MEYKVNQHAEDRIKALQMLKELKAYVLDLYIAEIDSLDELEIPQICASMNMNEHFGDTFINLEMKLQELVAKSIAKSIDSNLEADIFGKEKI